MTAAMGLAGVRQSKTPPLVVDVSAGFIPYSLESKDDMGTMRRTRLQYDAPSIEENGTGYSFGVVIGLQPPNEPNRRRDAFELPSQLLNIAGFPVLVEYRDVTLAAPPLPSGATSACYVKPRTSKRFFGPMWTGGIVIARHSLAGIGFKPGVAVPMLPAGSLSVADVDGTTVIDAAILDCGAIPSSARPLMLAAAVAPGQRTTVRAVSGTFAADVLRVNDHPTYYGNLVAHRVFLDKIGVAGDSGSLVATRAPRSECVGLYMGTTGGSSPEGIVQSMRQVVHYFDVELYD
jgi:hypothetical protein